VKKKGDNKHSRERERCWKNERGNFPCYGEHGYALKHRARQAIDIAQQARSQPLGRVAMKKEA